MDRIEEYNNLVNALEATPAALSNTISRAQAKAKKSGRLTRLLLLPASSLAVLFAAFVVIVNASTAFAMTCGRIPVLRELAAAVAFSPSLSAAVRNDYVQPINQSETQNGITMKVEYVIVDQKQLNIFYTLDSERYSGLDATPSIRSADGKPLEGYSISSGSYGVQKGELRQISVDFVDNNMPDSLTLTCKVHDIGSGTATATAPAAQATAVAPAPAAKDQQIFEPEEYKEPMVLSTFDFSLVFDPTFTKQGEVITLNQPFVLDAQKLTATTVEVYPSHIRLNLADDESNTAWLTSLTFALEDEKGKRFEQIGNGITATGSPDSPMMCSHRLESPFFAHSKKLTLLLTGAVWLDKDMERVRVDLSNKTASALPEGVTIEEAERQGSSWLLTFNAPYRTPNANYQLFTTTYYDEAGKKYEYNSWSSGTRSRYDEATKQYVESTDKFEVRFMLVDYPYDVVYLCPSYSRSVKLSTPVVIKVK